MARNEDMVNARFFVEGKAPRGGEQCARSRFGRVLSGGSSRLRRRGWRGLLVFGLTALVGAAGTVAATVEAGAQGGDAAPAVSPPRAGISSAAVVVGLAVLPAGGRRARVQIETVGRIRPEVYQVGGPARLVIDAGDLDFRLPSEIKRVGGLVRAVRYGHVGSGRGRIVADIGEGVTIAAVTSEHVGGRLYRLHIDLAVTQAVAQQRAPAETAASGELRPAVAAGGAAAAGLQTDEGGPREGSGASARRPVVVIDPGHGGIDPGAVVNRIRLEKAIVLAVGLRIQRLLREGGQVDVVMTRSSDVFLSLDDRIERSREARADLFLSLHADAVAGAELARFAGGASIYILSNKASDEISQRVAEKENAADLIGGVLARPAEDDGVRGILVDLLTRETERESQRLRNLLVVEMRRDVAMSRKPMRSAAFHVLKQAETPAALIELGFMTNPVDLGLMRQEKWRDQVAKAIARAVHRFFKERR